MKNITTGESIMLQNGQLKAEILTPWSTAYDRTRFAHTGFITGLWLGDTCFTQAERSQTNQSSTGGIGLCSEYKCRNVELDSAVGEEYLKIGVGAMVRTADLWTIVDEQRVQGLPATLQASDDTAVFECISPSINGYAYREKRTIRLEGQVLRQEYELENTGSKVLDIAEYSHNFVSLGDLTTDETHRLELPCLKNPTVINSNEFYGTEYGATWKEAVKGSFSAVLDDSQASEPYAWKLSSSRTNASIAEVLDFTPGLVVLWGTSYCVSAEIYKPLVIQPGETARWSREWHLTV